MFCHGEIIIANDKNHKNTLDFSEHLNLRHNRMPKIVPIISTYFKEIIRKGQKFLLIVKSWNIKTKLSVIEREC